MFFLSPLKKIFGSKKKVRRGEADRPQAKDLEVFRPVANQIAQQIGDIKLTLTAMAASDRGPLDHKRFCIKLNSFVKHLKEDNVLREYVHYVYPENQQQSYYLIVEELSRTGDELSSNLKNMEFFNNRNARVAEMMIEVTQIKSCHQEKITKVYTDLETLLKQRLIHKWSTLKTSNNKQLLKKFLSEIKGQKDAIRFWQTKAEIIMRAPTETEKRAARDFLLEALYERLEQSTGNDGNHDEVADDVRCTDDLDDSSTSTSSVTDYSSSSVVVENGGGWDWTDHDTW